MKTLYFAGICAPQAEFFRWHNTTSQPGVAHAVVNGVVVGDRDDLVDGSKNAPGTRNRMAKVPKTRVIFHQVCVDITPGEPNSRFALTLKSRSCSMFVNGSIQASYAGHSAVRKAKANSADVIRIR